MTTADTLGLVGTTVADKYDVMAVVGEGGSAVVYRAMHRLWKRPVALKLFKSLGSVSPQKREELLEKLVQEGQLLAELSERCAAIVQARDVGTFETARGEWVPYMVLEWLDGVTLEKALADERRAGAPPRSIAEAIQLLDPVAEALALAHKRGIAHRDVKPQNLFLLGDPRDPMCPAKILDFGIAKVVADAHKDTGAFSKTTGQITSFTPAYAAPEQFSRTHGSTGPWTDVFALALMMVELTTGKAPLDGDDYGQLAVASAHPVERPTPRRMGATVSDAVEAVFLRALAVEPQQRFPTVGEFWSALRAAASEPLRVIATGAPPPPSAVDTTARATTSVSRAAAPQGLELATAADPTRDAASMRGPASRAPLAIAVVLGVAVLGGAGLLLAHRGEESVSAAKTPAAVPAPPAPPATPAAPGPASCPEGTLFIPGGKFFMGSDDKADLEFERPAHKVTVTPFCMDKFEVNTGDYRACSDQGECKRASLTNEWDGIGAKERKAYDPLCNARDPGTRASHPINCVDWEQASTYCRVKGKRLPTEAEWEFAARGPDGRKYPWGDDDPSPGFLNACGKECVAWGKKNGEKLEAMYQADDAWDTTAPVGSFPRGASRYGVQDVVGNVWEWVSDRYGDYKADELEDPTGPNEGDERVIRGGAWNGAYASWVRPTFRYHSEPGKRSHGIGFRCALPLATAKK